MEELKDEEAEQWHHRLLYYHKSTVSVLDIGLDETIVEHILQFFKGKQEAKDLP